MNIKSKHNILGTDDIQNKSNFAGWPAVSDLSKLLKSNQTCKFQQPENKKNKNRKQTKYTQVQTWP